MKKLKKSLAVILAIFMIASFTPLFASAAVAASKTNCVLVEAPKFKLAGADDSTAVKDIVVQYVDGLTWSAIELVGGKITYTDPETGVTEEVADKFIIRSTYLTRAMTVGTQTLSAKIQFEPTDTEKFSKGTWNSTASSPLENWPSVTVQGLTATVESYPTVTCLKDTYPSASKVVTGAKIVDENGNDVTDQGNWFFTSETNKLQETEGVVELDMYWQSSVYNRIDFNKYPVTVKQGVAVLDTPPTLPEEVRSGTYSSNVEVTPGKVVDETGAEITDGTWSLIDAPYVLYQMEITLKVQWYKAGYEKIITEVPIKVKQSSSMFNIVKQARFAISGQSFTYDPSIKWEKLEIIPGIVTNKDGEVLEGTYSVSKSGTIGSNTKNQTATIKFNPADSKTYYTYYGFTDYVGPVGKAQFELGEDFKVVLGEGECTPSSTGTVSLSGNALRYSTLTVNPKTASVNRISFSSSEFDPSTAQPGDKAIVTATITPSDTNYVTKTAQISVEIQKAQIDGTFAGVIRPGDHSIRTSHSQTDPKQEIRYQMTFTQPRLKGNVEITLIAPDGSRTLVNTVAPDENGLFTVDSTTFPTMSGTHQVEFKYVPSENDTAIVAGDLVILKEERITLLYERTIYLTIGKVTKEYKVMDSYTGSATAQVTTIADDFPGWDPENLISWTFKDEDGNEFIPDRASASASFDPVTLKYLYFKMPLHDVYVTANLKNQPIIDIGGGDNDNDNGNDNVNDSNPLDSFLAFWNKIVDFVVKIYQLMYDMFKF